MSEIASLFEFSRRHCVAICAVLVPANLLATLQVLVGIALCRPPAQIRLSVTLTTVLASLLVLHVGTWLAIGVVRPVTFILFGLAATCWLLAVGTAAYPQAYQNWIRWLLGRDQRPDGQHLGRGGIRRIEKVHLH